MTGATELKFLASRSAGEVSALLRRPDAARWMLVMGHGAGAGMRHRFMEDAATVLAAHGIGTFRYQFPYVERGLRRTDPRPILLATVRSAVAAARAATPDLPLLAGGKSMGGRMTSLAQAQEELEGVRGIVFFGFPLHPAGEPGTERGDHLASVTAPMLFLQGTRDKLADLGLLRPVIERLGRRGTLHIVEGADHGFDVLKRSGRTLADVLEDLAVTVEAWAGRHVR
jgi:predicted alpha/beta-hydrolase family hydrolase